MWTQNGAPLVLRSYGIVFRCRSGAGVWTYWNNETRGNWFQLIIGEFDNSSGFQSLCRACSNYRHSQNNFWKMLGKVNRIWVNLEIRWPKTLNILVHHHILWFFQAKQSYLEVYHGISTQFQTSESWDVHLKAGPRASWMQLNASMSYRCFGMGASCSEKIIYG